MGSGIQQYCLRWNNHRSNLLLVFEHLFQTESFTDVTLACDGSSIKCHKMVLAACSSYFQQLFMENECKHPIVVLKDIKVSEIKAILEYMYKGEVNVAQDQLSGLLKAAETLKVKGLVEDNNHHNQQHPQTPPNQSPYSHATPSNVSSSSEYGRDRERETSCSSSYPKSNSVPSTTTPKYLQNSDSPVYDAPYNASSYPDKNSIPFHLWQSRSNHPLSPSPKNYENEPVPLKKKKFLGSGSGSNSGGNGSRDTPILRTVLGHTALGQHNAIDYQRESNNTSPYHGKGGGSNYGSGQPSQIQAIPITTNGPTDHSNKMRQESPEHYMDESIRSVESDKVHEENSAFGIDEDVKPGISPYVSGQKPEWKRYKQYTRNDIMAAIEAVKTGMSALQAARKYGVPSRTLYDKVKKLGITTNRPYRKGSFPMSPYQLNLKNEVDPYKDTSHYSPEDLPLDISSTGNDSGSGSGGLEFPPNGSDHGSSNGGENGGMGLSIDHKEGEEECSTSANPTAILGENGLENKTLDGSGNGNGNGSGGIGGGKGNPNNNSSNINTDSS